MENRLIQNYRQDKKEDIDRNQLEKKDFNSSMGSSINKFPLRMNTYSGVSANKGSLNDDILNSPGTLDKALQVLKVPEGMTVYKAVEIMEKYFNNESGENELNYEDFEHGILEVFDLQDINDFDKKAQDMILDAIDKLFYVCDVDDRGFLDMNNLVYGLKKFLPEDKLNIDRVSLIADEFKSVEQRDILFSKLDKDGTGVIHTENFEAFLSEFIKDKNKVKSLAHICMNGADVNRSGSVNKLEFINWSKTKSYKNLIEFIEGKSDLIFENKQGGLYEDAKVSYNAKTTFNKSKTMISSHKNIDFQDLFLNKNKEGLANSVRKLKDKKKITDFQNFFKNIDFRAAIKDIKTLAINSGLYRISPLDLIRYMK